MTVKRYNPYQLKVGAKVEMEHHMGRKMAQKIAKDHLNEFPNYYTYLLGMEKMLKNRQRKAKN